MQREPSSRLDPDRLLSLQSRRCVLGVAARLVTEALHCTNSQSATLSAVLLPHRFGGPATHRVRRPMIHHVLAELEGQGCVEWSHRVNNGRVVVIASVDTGP